MHNREQKYKLIVHFIEDRILSGEYRLGDKIPSVNAFKIRFGISRSSIFLAMDELKARGIIEAESAIGYYVASDMIKVQEKVLLLFNELNSFKQDLYDAFMEEIGDDASVDIMFHNYNRQVFDSVLKGSKGRYTAFVLMPGKFKGLDTALESLGGYVLLMDHYSEELRSKFPSVGQDFENDTFNALKSSLDKIRKYSCITLVQHEEKEPEERYEGIRKFCEDFGFESRNIPTLAGSRIGKGELFLTADDREMVSILKKAAEQGLEPGKDFGLISYNDTPVKEILSGGIATLSTDFKAMGRTAAALVKEKSFKNVTNPSYLELRASV